ncbi:MAG TPA: hypothetical protein VNL17_14350 [Verrucomicrobiae bacterium]|nr:hypothetical protein [Verrucomicrobiae bacterium]
MPRSDQPSLDLLIMFLGLTLAIMGALTVFFTPKYETGFQLIIMALLSAFSGACGAKWGLSQQATTPPPAGTVQRTELSTKTTEVAPAVPPQPTEVKENHP